MINRRTISILVVIVSFFILTYRLTESFIFHPDFARDMFDITRISQGKLMLIGPKLTFGGIYSGPYYYYLFLPIALITRQSVNAILLFNTLLFSVSIGFFFYKVSQKSSFTVSLFASACILFSPLIIIASRNPSNAFTYIPLLLILLTVVYFDKIHDVKKIFALGIFAGILTTFHAVTASTVLVVAVLIFVGLKEKQKFVWFPLGGILAFTPLIVFEMKHNFIMFKNTFIDKSYQLWINNKNIPGGITGKKNPIENFFFISQAIEKFLAINPIYGILTTTVITLRKRLTNKEIVLMSGSVVSLILMACLMRFQFIYHYLFAIILLILFTVVVVLAKYRILFLLIVLLAFELTFIPKEQYVPSWRTTTRYQKAISYVINNNIVNKGESFNIIQVTQPDLLSPNGFEYRFFLQQNGFVPDSEFTYKTSQKLLLFIEKPQYDIKKLDTWESREFGNEYIAKAKKYTSGTITIYVAEK